MSAYGYADGQSITGWLGVPLVEQTALAIGAGTQDFGPFPLTNFASVIVAVKPTGGQVTVKVKQTIGGGPASLELDETFVVPAGATAFEAIVLFADTVTVELVGGAVGTTVDFAVYPSNTTTNAQVITQATINVQHNDALVAAEPTLDFEDALGFVWTIADDAPNTRVKITPPTPGLVKIAEALLLAPAASIAFAGIPAGYSTARITLIGRGTAAAGNVGVGLQANGDTGANYQYQEFQGIGAGTSIADHVAQNSLLFGNIAAASMPAGYAGAAELVIPDYAGTTFHKQVLCNQFLERNAGNDAAGPISGAWLSAAAMNALKLTPTAGAFDTGTHAILSLAP